MISRRNIRVKVMQALYTIEQMGGESKPGEALTILRKGLDQSKQLFTYLVYFTTEVARYAEADSRNRASKHLPSANDLSVNTKIAGNSLLWKILENPGFTSSVEKNKSTHLLPAELVKSIYQELVQSTEYEEYISLQERPAKMEKDIIEYIFSHLMLPNELFISHLEDHFIHWDDDAEMMEQLVLGFLQKNGQLNFNEMVTKEKMEFAENLLHTVLDKKEYMLELIKPKLKNWDADRIAALDMILMQMGLCEFLYFETIPVRVTINEYIDLAKAYSTPQSGHFVNGILDNINKELSAANKIQKKTFKNSTL